MIPADDALRRLRDGNRRFVNGETDNKTVLTHARRAELVGGQTPFAVILACSDSRVPVEMIFDQGLGDLFVIRVAGNIVAPSLVGSVEFAAANLGTKLVIVLGHSNCGAVEATLKTLAREPVTRTPNLRSIVDRIRPALEPLAGATMNEAVRANVRQSVEQLAHGSPDLEERVAVGELTIVGAEYSIESGEVEFFADQ